MKKNNLWCPLAFNGILSNVEGRYGTCCWASSNAKEYDTGENITRNMYTLEEAFNHKYFLDIRNNLKNGMKTP